MRVPVRAGDPRGFTLLEVIGTLAIAAILLGVGLPMLNGARLGASLSSAEEIVMGALLRARWMAINSGSTRTVDLSDRRRIQVRGGDGTVLFAADLGEYAVEVAGSSPSFAFDGRGFVSPANLVRITVVNRSGSRQITVSTLGHIRRS